MKMLLSLFLICAGGSAFGATLDNPEPIPYTTSDPDSKAMAVWLENGNSPAVHLIGYVGDDEVLAVDPSLIHLAMAGNRMAGYNKYGGSNNPNGMQPLCAPTRENYSYAPVKGWILTRGNVYRNPKCKPVAR